jgi:hypothetical protein
VRYLLLIYGDEAGPEPPEGMDTHLKRYYELDDDLRAAGAFVEGLPLQATSTAKTVRVRNGEALTTDGPFAETKEQLGGFYLVDAPDLDAALRWAAAIPGAGTGAVEVRPILELPATFAEYQQTT